jgi:hypothetical protein
MIEPGTKIRFIDPNNRDYVAWHPTKLNVRLQPGDIVTAAGWDNTYRCPYYETVNSTYNVLEKGYWEKVEEPKAPCTCDPPSLLLMGCTCGAHR